MTDNEKEGKNTEDLQQKYMQMQMFQQQMEQVQKQLQLMEKQLVELDLVKKALGDLKNVKEDAEILVPLSSGIFVKAELKDNKKVTVNVGRGVATEKTIEQAQELISQQADELTKVRAQLTEDMSKMGVQANGLQQELQKLVN
ncbi:MAG: prefoldin subunit alpha [Nanoarchaeota archaeon]|nr:prefoldin subunit alpha [Nanoarchaeota archaeon]